MSDPRHCRLLILGSGPAGYTAAVYAARANLDPVLITGMEQGGQLMTTTDVDNWPGGPEGLQGPGLMMDMQAHAERFGTEVIFDHITAVDFSERPFRLTGDSQGYSCDALIIATGASAKLLGLDQEAKLMGHGVSACATCDGFFYRNQEVVIVGAGDSACEEASYLAKLCTKVHMLVRRDQMRASKAMQHRVMGIDNIEIHWNTETVDILGAEQVEGAKVRNNQTGEETVLPVTGFFLAIGHKPNTDIFAGQVDLDEEGYIIAARPGSSYTNVEGVFWSGDACDKTYRQAITAAGTGCMAALDAERYLAEKGIH